jgi:hypothetical protein
MEKVHGRDGMQRPEGNTIDLLCCQWVKLSPEQLTTGVITKLLEATHGQWLYCCIQIHDRCKGTQATLRKEEVQKEIEAQQEMGYHGLLDEDLYLAEVNLKDSESTSGE